MGSNLSDPEHQLNTAIIALSKLEDTQVIAQSSWRWTTPLGPVEQPDFLNGAVALRTQLEPLVLLDALQTIEKQQHRVRHEHWGPRTLDLDIILYGDKTIVHPRLIVPHPQMHLRDFVLDPLLDIDPDLCLPDLTPIQQLIDNLKDRFNPLNP